MSEPDITPSPAAKHRPTGATAGSDAVLKSFTFLFFMTMSIIVSVFPIYFDYKGYSKLQIGMLYSIGPTVGIAANLFWGVLSDKLQTIKKVMITVLAGQLIALLIMFQVDTFTVMFIVMTAYYFFQTPMNGLIDSQTLLVASKTGKSYASYRIWGSLGFSFASLFFGMALSGLGIQSVTFLTLGTVIISFGLAFLLKDSRAGARKADFSGVRSILFSKQLLWFFLLILLLAIPAKANDGFLALYMIGLGANETIIGYSWMISALSEIPVMFLLSKYGHRFKELPLLGFAGLIYGIRFLLMASVQNPYWIIAIQAMHCLSFGIFFITAIRYITQLVPDEFRASGQAMFNVVWGGMAGLAGGAIGGQLFDLWGGDTVYLFASITAFIASAGFFLTHISRKFSV